MTFAVLATRPAQLFEALDPKRPLGDAWRFAALTVGMVIGAFVCLALLLGGVGLLMVTLNGDMGSANHGGVAAAPGGVLAIIGILYLFAMSVGPLCSLAFLMVGHHPLLRLVGGGQRGWRATLQVGLYSLAFYPLAVIPCIGMFVLMGILGYQAIGYSKIHDEPVWKSSLAVFLPMGFFGLLYILLFAFTAGFLNDFSL